MAIEHLPICVVVELKAMRTINWNSKRSLRVLMRGPVQPCEAKITISWFETYIE